MHPNTPWFIPAGSSSDNTWNAVITPNTTQTPNSGENNATTGENHHPQWQHTGLRVATLHSTHSTLTLAAEPTERIIVPLRGGCTVTWHSPDGNRRTQQLHGRAHVFDGPTDVLYLGINTPATITSVDARIAIAEAPTTQPFPAQYLPAENTPIELRGAGQSSRQVHNFGTPQAIQAAKLIACEVITPAGNWSSYPAHKHDQHTPGTESELEEIYYFESAPSRANTPPATAEPFGLFTTYPSPGNNITNTQIVRTGDIALVPYGYHGPAAAAPGYDLYYLNVMAGPHPERTWLITDDPAHAWIRDQWAGMEIDPRLPYRASTPSNGTKQ